MTAMHPRSQVYSPTHMACITDVDTDGDGYAPIWDRALKDRAELAERLAIEAWQKQSVYDLADQKIGRIVDLVIKKDGAVPAAIISVGGSSASRRNTLPFRSPHSRQHQPNVGRTSYSIPIGRRSGARPPSSSIA